MPATLTPLRYPGGKTKLYPLVRDILECNGLIGQTYIEPFAGGAGLALKLLLRGDVKRIVINDFDPSIYAFWYSVIEHTAEFCELIRISPLTIDEWNRQKEIFSRQDAADPLSLGFSTFFLNRTNISGVIKGGLIGGIQQNGNYQMDARFTKATSIKKIEDIARYKSNIHIYNLDAQVLLSPAWLGQYYKVLINFDPPYVKKGSKLYKNAFEEADHRGLAEKIANCHRKWIVTYDICPLIAEIYSGFRHGFLDVSYSISTPKAAKEYIFYSDNLKVPEGEKIFCPQKKTPERAISLSG